MRKDRETVACGTYGDGAIVEALVYGERHAYNTISKRAWGRNDDPDEDWREQFLCGKPGRVLTYKGTFYARADATQLIAVYITSAALSILLPGDL